MNVTSSRLLRLHGAMLMLVALCFTIVAYSGVLFSMGPYRALAETPMVAGALAQAYPLVGLVGLCLWTGAPTDRQRLYSIVGIAAHCAPLATYVALWDTLIASPLSKAAPLGLTIHRLGTALEMFALRAGYRGFGNPKCRRQTP